MADTKNHRHLIFLQELTRFFGKDGWIAGAILNHRLQLLLRLRRKNTYAGLEGEIDA